MALGPFGRKGLKGLVLKTFGPLWYFPKPQGQLVKFTQNLLNKYIVTLYYLLNAFQISRLRMLGVVQQGKMGNALVLKLHARLGMNTYSRTLSIINLS